MSRGLFHSGAFFGASIALLLAVFVVPARSAHGETLHELTEMKLKTFSKDNAVRAYPYYERGAGSMSSIEADVATYKVKYVSGSGEEGIRPLKLVIIATGEISWAGPEQDYYIKRKGELYGLKVTGGSLLWTPTRFSHAETEKASRIRSDLEEKLTARSLLDMMHGGPAEGVAAVSRTDLRPIFSEYKLWRSSFEDPAQISVIKWLFQGDELILVVQGEDPDKRVRIYVDLDDKKVSKTEIAK